MVDFNSISISIFHQNQTEVACHVSVADGVVATPIILGQRHSEVGWPVPFFAAVRFPVIDQYPLRLGEPRAGSRARESNPAPFAP